jgi:hypothetical protein
VGQTPQNARKVGSRENLGLQGLLEWAAKEFGAQDLFVLEAASKSAPLAAADPRGELPVWLACGKRWKTTRLNFLLA